MEMRSLVDDLNSFLGGEAASEGISWSKGFSIDGENVRVLESPSQYYDTLLTQIQGARRNVVLSALYLGTGKLERRLIRELGEALEREENLRITLIFDFNRVHREYTCSDSGSIVRLVSRSRSQQESAARRCQHADVVCFKAHPR